MRADKLRGISSLGHVQHLTYISLGIVLSIQAALSHFSCSSGRFF